MIKNGIYGYYDTKKNQIVYVGQAKDIYKRHNQHMMPSYYNQQVINRILQNNSDRYKLVIIKARPNFSKEDRDILEKHYIEFYNTFIDDNKFNFTTGGNCDLLSVESRKKMSEAKKGKKIPQETRKKMSEAQKGEKNHFYGKHHTEETCKKISEVLSKSCNTSGYFRVCKQRDNNCKQGFIWAYRYYIENGKQKKICSVNIKKLEEKVKSQGLPWKKIN